MISSLHTRPVYSLESFPNTLQQSVESLDVITNTSRSRAADSQLVIVNNKITNHVETIVDFICKLHTSAQQNEQKLHHFELTLTDPKAAEQLNKLKNDCKNGLLKAEDMGTGNYSLIVSYNLSISVLANIHPLLNYTSQFHEMNKFSTDVFLKLGPALDLLIPEIREKSQQFYKIKNAMDLSWGFAEIKDSVLYLANIQDHLYATLVRQVATLKEHEVLLKAGLKKLEDESNRFVIRDNNPLHHKRVKELAEEISFLTTHSKAIGSGIAIYDDLLSFLANCQVQLHSLCSSIDQLETYYPLLLKSELNEAGY